MGWERPQFAIAQSPFGPLTVNAWGSGTSPAELEVKAAGSFAVEGERFDSFSAFFALDEGKLRAKSVYPSRQRPDGRLSGFSLRTATRKKVQAEVKKALLEHRRDLVQLELALLEQLEEALSAKKRTLIGLGAVPTTETQVEESALASLIAQAHVGLSES